MSDYSNQSASRFDYFIESIRGHLTRYLFKNCQTCGDIYTHRGVLSLMDKQFGLHFLLQTYLGIASNVVQPWQREERKSIGAERYAACNAGSKLADNCCLGASVRSQLYRTRMTSCASSRKWSQNWRLTCSKASGRAKQ